MSREWLLYVMDIRDSCRKIETYTASMTREQFLADDRTVDAVIRNLMIIGEATRRVPEEMLASMPDINWRRVADMRNVLAHAYFGIDEDILWDVIRNHVPPMLAAVEEFLSKRPTTES